MIPVLIEDLVKKVTDKSQHVEKRQHYAQTLRIIYNVVGKALEQFDREWSNK